MHLSGAAARSGSRLSTGLRHCAHRLPHSAALRPQRLQSGAQLASAAALRAYSSAAPPPGYRAKLACLDLEGVLIPEIWVNLAERVGVEALLRTTRDEPCYNTLMRYRLDIMQKEGLGMSDIHAVIDSMEPMEGAAEFVEVRRLPLSRSLCASPGRRSQRGRRRRLSLRTGGKPNRSRAGVWLSGSENDTRSSSSRTRKPPPAPPPLPLRLWLC